MMMNRSAQTDDSATGALIRKIINVPKSVQMCALRYFLDKTTELGAIAFFQWRYKFPNMYTNEEDLVEII
jgi:hypothetical protein